MEKYKTIQGITLIALIITMIILLILTGITIGSITGQNGLIEKANQAKNVNLKAQMKEALILAISDLQIEKEGNATIDDITQEFLEEKLKEYKCEIIEDSITEKKIKIEKDGVTNIFVIDKNLNIKEELSEDKPQETDKDIPTIGEDIDISNPIEIETYISIKSNTVNTLNLSNIEEINYLIESKTDNLNLEGNVLTANDKANSYDICKILITGKYEGQSYKNNLTVFVEPKNRTTIQDKNGNIKEAFAIYEEQDLIRMQEIVSTGANNKCNVKMMNDLKLNENLYQFNENGKIVFNETAKKYNIIGTKDHPFLGIFEGNGKIISGLYLKLEENEKNGGLFGIVRQNAEIKNITLKDSYVSGEDIGCIVGYNEGTIYRCKVETSTIETNAKRWAGGIAGINNGDIIECATSGYFYGMDIGGIAGLNGTNAQHMGITPNSTTGKIYRCYTSGYIGFSETSGIVSHSGSYGGEGYINDCYSIANVEDNYHKGAITSVNGYLGTGYINNSYYLNLKYTFAGVSTPAYAGNINNSYQNDTSITAEKLNTEESKEIWINDVKDESGNWKYNNGYPILKWQTEV